jgi:hypothetical protein
MLELEKEFSNSRLGGEGRTTTDRATAQQLNEKSLYLVMRRKQRKRDEMENLI